MNSLAITYKEQIPKKNLVDIFPPLRSDVFFIALILFGSISVLIISLKFDVFFTWRDFLSSTKFLRISAYFLIASSIVVVGGYFFRTLLWLRYKPMTLDLNKGTDWPYVSVILPALNEEESVQASIDSIFASYYPQDKLEVICIDDGSTDSTWQKMMKAKQKYRDKIKVIHFAKNLGKRKALYKGISNSKGEIIVTIDSDSQIDPNAIRNIVIPLIKEKNCGAVAGRVEVLNKEENFLTRMLSVRYSISFNFGRAYQSVYGTVFCCPGALTAYRRDVLFEFINKWIRQKFSNTRCTYGEDRALTTLTLKSGYMTKFQSNAVVYTKVPSQLSKMIRMYIRWNRSCFRETILFARFMFSRYREHHRVFPLVDFFFLNIIYPFRLISFSIITYSFVIEPLLILRHIAFIIIASFCLSLYYLRSRKSIVFLYGIPYGIITAFCLWWIYPFAALTVRSKSWMTR